MDHGHHSPMKQEQLPSSHFLAAPAFAAPGQWQWAVTWCLATEELWALCQVPRLASSSSSLPSNRCQYGALRTQTGTQQAFNPSSWEVEARGSEVGGYPQLHGELESSLSYMWMCLKNKKMERGRGACDRQNFSTLSQSGQPTETRKLGSGASIENILFWCDRIIPGFGTWVTWSLSTVRFVLVAELERDQECYNPRCTRKKPPPLQNPAKIELHRYWQLN